MITRADVKPWTVIVLADLVVACWSVFTYVVPVEDVWTAIVIVLALPVVVSSTRSTKIEALIVTVPLVILGGSVAVLVGPMSTPPIEWDWITLVGVALVRFASPNTGYWSGEVRFTDLTGYSQVVALCFLITGSVLLFCVGVLAPASI